MTPRIVKRCVAPCGTPAERLRRLLDRASAAPAAHRGTTDNAVKKGLCVYVSFSVGGFAYGIEHSVREMYV